MQEESINFFSSSFDPLVALQHPTLEPPIPKVKALNNIAECRFLLPPGTEDARRKPTPEELEKQAQRKREREEIKQRIEAAKERNLQRQRRRLDAKGEDDIENLDLDKKMTGGFKSGPFLLLAKCFTEKARIRVVVRRIDGVRGVCTGFIRAFDKHLNLVLFDVEETYTESEYHRPFYAEQIRKQQQHRSFYPPDLKSRPPPEPGRDPFSTFQRTTQQTTQPIIASTSASAEVNTSDIIALLAPLLDTNASGDNNNNNNSEQRADTTLDISTIQSTLDLFSGLYTDSKQTTATTPAATATATAASSTDTTTEPPITVNRSRTSGSSKRKRKVAVLKTRYLRQLFIKGDCVILISRAPS